MDHQQRIKVIQDWVAGKFRSPVPHNGNGAVKPAQPSKTAARPVSRRLRLSQVDVPAGVYTSVWGDNAELMERIASLYFKAGDRIADVTYGKGVFWRDIDATKYDFYPSDMKTCLHAPYDFRCLSYQDASFDVVVFDPPYMHGSGLEGFEKCYRNGETTKGMGHTDIMRMYEDGMGEATRILKRNGLLVVKCQDEIESGWQRWSHIEVYDIAQGLGMTAQDLFVLTRTQSPTIQFTAQRHARKNHSYMWVFRKSDRNSPSQS